MTACPNHECDARYEVLRAWALDPAPGSSRPVGLALLQQGGLPAWMQAVAKAEPQEQPARGEAGALHPGGLRAPLACLLAAMALGVGSEEEG